ncbi:HD domain-containing protein [Cellulomonas sp. P5_C5]
MIERTAPGVGVSDTLGLGGVHVDQLWQTVISLSPLETALLRTWQVRRLGLVAHAGAASLVTTQSYSRLEHSLGLLALVASVDPDDTVTRAAALLHDVGHLPFSHTLEGVRGLDHHVLGTAAVLTLDGLLARHGVAVSDVLATVEGSRPSALTQRSGLLSLDHLDSYVRSGRVHGREHPDPAALLGRLRVVDGAVETDLATAQRIVRLVADEVAYHCSPLNVLVNGILRHLVGTLLDQDPGLDELTLAAMTDGQLLAALLAGPATSSATEQFLADPTAWHVHAAGGGGRTRPPGAIRYDVSRLYLARPLVDGEALPVPEPDPRHVEVPATFWITPGR